MADAANESTQSVTALPVIDVGPLLRNEDCTGTAAAIRDACTSLGFFYISGHGVPPELITRLHDVSVAFFSLPEADKLKIRMELGGRAWRGYFPVRGELTSGVADVKEGLYFGEELHASDARVVAGTPLHGPNLWPDQPVAMRAIVTEYMHAVQVVAAGVMKGIALSLGLHAHYFDVRDPLVLFRVFNYPAGASEGEWGVGEHTDYGVLTLLLQDDVGGLQVKARSGEWVSAPPVPGTFVCNLGDMLERMTRGVFKSTLHRVRNAAACDRLSFPLFYDPPWTCVPAPIPDEALARVDVSQDVATRWDGASVHDFRGTYGEYIMAKVGKVFPELRERVEV